jgi:hypothetical protein
VLLDQAQQLLVVLVVGVDVFQFQFQIRYWNQRDYQDYLYDVEFVDDRKILDEENNDIDLVLVAVDDLVRVKLNDMMMNVYEHLMETNIHS